MNEYKGGFNYSVRVYSVSRRGVATLVAKSDDCTWSGDAPSETLWVNPDEPVLVEHTHMGNGGSTHYECFGAASQRLANAGVTPSEATAGYWKERARKRAQAVAQFNFLFAS